MPIDAPALVRPVAHVPGSYLAVMTTHVSVFGLGYVGCVSAACFAKEGFEVTGVDVSDAKIAMINRGQATILEAGIQELVAEMVRAGRLRATASVAEAVVRRVVARLRRNAEPPQWGPRPAVCGAGL